MTDAPSSRARPAPSGPGLATRAGLRVRHAWWLGRDLNRSAAAGRTWWLWPVVCLVVLFGLALATTSTVLPVAVYTFF